jgi:hypothetical protein
VLLCDSAQTSQEGKLHVLGAGWSQVFRPVAQPGMDSLPPPTQFAIAASFLIDWNDAGRSLGVRVTIERQSDPTPVYEVQAQLTAGRSPQAIEGDPLRVLVALPVLINFPDSGGYVVRARMDGSPTDVTVRFQVSDALLPAPLPSLSG